MQELKRERVFAFILQQYIFNIKEGSFLPCRLQVSYRRIVRLNHYSGTAALWAAVFTGTILRHKNL